MKVNALVLSLLLGSGCVSSLAPSSDGGSGAPDVAPVIGRELPDAPQGAVWILPIEIGDVSEAPNRTTELDGGTLVRKIVANVTFTRTGRQPVQIGMIGPMGEIYPAVAAPSVPDREGAYGEQEAWGAHVLTTKTTGPHVLAVAYQGAAVDVELTPHAPVEAVGEWRESRGAIHVYDSRLDVEKTGVATGDGVPGTAAYRLDDQLQLEGAAFAHSFRMTSQSGSTEVILDGPTRWENHTRVLPPNGSSIGIDLLQLPPGTWDVEIQVLRTSGLNSLVIVEVPEAPASPFHVQVVTEVHQPGPRAWQGQTAAGLAEGGASPLAD